MRLIDADALVASLKQKHCADCCELFGCGDCAIDDYLRDISNAPTIEALEQRCKALDALEKRNEPMEPTLNENHSYVSDAFKCGKCGHIIRFHAKYCENCGQAVKWE